MSFTCENTGCVKTAGQEFRKKIGFGNRTTKNIKEENFIKLSHPRMQGLNPTKKVERSSSTIVIFKADDIIFRETLAKSDFNENKRG